jgi:hypothetical protein
MHWTALLASALILGSSGAGAAQRCAPTSDERSWVESSLAASDYIMMQRLHLPPDPHPTIIVFNDKCRFELPEGSKKWLAESHNGKIRLLRNSTVDAGLIAMADQVEQSGRRYFVIALPSVWIANKAAVPGDPGLTAVFLHEFSHTRQMKALQPLFQAAARQYKPPEYFNDDSLQAHFKSDPVYVAAYEKEDDLLYRAAAEPDPAKARELAKQALELIDARQKRFFTGADAMWKPYDDLFLTMEGFGQWNAYAWLADPRGAGMTTDAAREKMRGKRHWWSQEEGLGLFLVIDRFAPNWAAEAFAPNPKLGIDLLREAVNAPASAAGPAH